MYSALTCDIMKSYPSHVCETRKFVMTILHWKQGLSCDKKTFYKYSSKKGVSVRPRNARFEASLLRNPESIEIM